jgi:uncharacterized protein (DUF488 family)
VDGEILIHTIGHSDHPIAALIEVLRQHAIGVVVDVRSQPYSRWTPQFNRELLAHDLEAAGIRYRFMGDRLGGRPGDESLYPQSDGQPDYRLLEQTPAYQAGIQELLRAAASARVAVMCSEGDYHHCHRHLLISQSLLERGVRVLHILPDGALVPAERVARQLTLF